MGALKDRGEGGRSRPGDGAARLSAVPAGTGEPAADGAAGRGGRTAGDPPGAAASQDLAAAGFVAVPQGPHGGPGVPDLKVATFIIKRNDSIYSILSGLGVEAAEIAKITRSARRIYDLRRIKAGDELRVVKRGERVERLEYRYDELEGLYVERAGQGRFEAGSYEVPHEIGHKVVSGVVETSLYEAGVEAGAAPKAVVAMTDIFAWDVDFATDMRRGDTFRILYETVAVEGEIIRMGRVLAAELVNAGRRYTAVYYEDGKGRGGYYDTEGRSLSRTLLKSPLRYSRISSYFSRKRFHPILKKYRPHHGIDYAAPAGTPVEAAGDGKVVFAGWRKGYGYFVKIRHNGIYTTGYGHFSRIARGVKRGARVRQGQVIGYVGSTGISTGPHLHYEVVYRGRLVNPLSIRSTPKRSVSKDERARFEARRDELLARLHGAPTVVASVKGGGGEGVN